MQRVNDALEAAGPDVSRDAHFICVLALAWPDGHVEWFEGRVDGTLVWPPRGTGGFGYNPIFVPERQRPDLCRDARCEEGDQPPRAGVRRDDGGGALSFLGSVPFLLPFRREREGPRAKSAEG